MLNRVKVSTLETLINRVLTDAGLSVDNANSVTEILINTSLRGVDTHGIRLLETYVNELRGGRSNKNPQYTLIKRTPTTLCLDADNALGILASRYAMSLAEETAEELGVAAVSVSNSNHFGAASSYSIPTAKKGFLAFSFSNSDALVSPAHGIGRKLGTNPICFAAPLLGDELFCLDMATSQVSFSFIKQCISSQIPLGRGWAMDERGDDASVSSEFASLQPLGGYKGQGLAMMVTILSAILSGMPIDDQLSHLYEPPYDSGRKIGHFFIVIKIEAFIDLKSFKQQCAHFCLQMRGDNEDVFWPGKKEAENEIINREKGIILVEPELTYLNKMAKHYGLLL